MSPRHFSRSIQYFTLLEREKVAVTDRFIYISYDDVYALNRKDLQLWLFIGCESVEFLFILVPLDGVERFAFHIKLALEMSFFAEELMGWNLHFQKLQC